MAAKRPLVHAGGSFVELPDADTLRLTQLAVTDGASTPDPGAPVWAWSTVETAPIYWNGSNWIMPATGAPSLSVPEAVDVLQVDLYVNAAAANVLISAGPVIDLTLPCFAVPNMFAVDPPVTGQLLYVEGSTTYNGIWVVGSTAVPSAVPLTRHSDWPTGALIRSGTTIVAARAFPYWAAVGGFPSNTYQIDTTNLGVDTANDAFTGAIAQYSGCWFKVVSVDGGASLPGGLSSGVWYYLDGTSTYDESYGTGYSPVYDLDLAPINLTSVGANDGSSGIIGTVLLLGVASFCASLSVALRSDSSLGGYVIEEAVVAPQISPVNPGYATPGRVQWAQDYYGFASGPNALSAGSECTALGNTAKALTSASTAVGGNAMAVTNATAVGAGARAVSGGVAVGAVTCAMRSGVALGKSGYSHSQISFCGPSSRIRDAFEVHQLYLTSAAWGVSAYPAKLYTSDAQRTTTPTRSGWRCYGPYAGLNRFVGRCVVTFYTVSSPEAVGHAVLRVEGSVRPTNGVVAPTVVYQVTEEESSYPGTLTLTLTPSEDPVDPAAMLEVEISCSLSIGTTMLDAYFGVQVWGVHNDNSLGASYTAPVINRGDAGILLTASEALTAGNLVNFWVDTGVAKMRKADASDDRAADGYVLQSVASGDKGRAFCDGENTAVSGLTVGSLYLGESGAASSSASGAGGISQSVGFATSATSFVFQRGLPVQL